MKFDNEEKLKYFHNSLCNAGGFSSIREGLTKEEYTKAQETAKPFFENSFLDQVCYEDVLMEHLKTTGGFSFHDTYEDEVITLTWEQISENIDKGLPNHHAVDLVNETDDAITADAYLQSACFGKVIYG